MHPHSTGRHWLTLPSAVLALFCLLFGLPVLAGEGDVFRPVLTAAYGHDSNIFRQPAGAASAVDYHQLGAGFLLDARPSRQRILARALVSRNRYSRFSRQLDYDGHELGLSWDWQLGNRWHGLLSAGHARTLSSYDNVAVTRNLRTDRSHELRVVRELHTDWQAELRLSHAQSRYATFTSRDVESTAAALGLYRLGGTLPRLGLELRHTAIDRPAGALSDAQEWGLFVVGLWQPSGQTRVNARLGQVRRDFEQAAVRDFQGVEGRIDADWAPTGKLLLRAALYRELTETDVGVNRNYRRDTGASADAQWLLSARTRVGANLRRDDQAYDGGPADSYQSHGVSASYQPWPDSTITLSWQHVRRDSNQPQRAYAADTVGLSATLVF